MIILLGVSWGEGSRSGLSQRGSQGVALEIAQGLTQEDVQELAWDCPGDNLGEKTGGKPG